MDAKTYEISRLSYLNDCLVAAIDVLTRAQRIGFNQGLGLTHTSFVPTSFGLPMQGMGVDPRCVDFGSAGFTHSPYYAAYPYACPPQQLGAWTGTQIGGVPTFTDCEAQGHPSSQ